MNLFDTLTLNIFSEDFSEAYLECSETFSIPVSKKTSTRCLKDVFLRQARHLAKTSCRYPKDVLNANLKVIFVRHLEDTFARYIVDVLEKTY